MKVCKILRNTSLFLLGLTLCSCAPQGVTPAPTSSATIGFNLDKDGSGNALLSVAKNYTDPSTGTSKVLTRDDINQATNTIIAKADAVASAAGRVNVGAVKESDSQFDVTLNFMRLQYLNDPSGAGDLGSYDYKNSADFVKEQDSVSNITVNWTSGSYRRVQTAYSPSSIYIFENEVLGDPDAAFNPILVREDNREIVDYDELVAYFDEKGPLSKNKNGKMFTFYMVDLEELESVTFTFSGEIITYGTVAPQKVEKNSITVLPVYQKAKVITTQGSETKTEDRMVKCFVGYVYFETPSDAWITALIIVGIVLLIALIILGFVFDWYKRLGCKIKHKPYTPKHDKKAEKEKENKELTDLYHEYRRDIYHDTEKEAPKEKSKAAENSKEDVIIEFNKKEYKILKKMNKKTTKSWFRKNYSLYLMLIPAVALLILFTYIPMAGIIVAFKNYRITDGIWGSEWTTMNGFYNFYNIFTNPGANFWMLLKNTFVLALWKFVFGFVLAVLLAVLFSYLKKGLFKKSVQTISYVPYFVSWVVISTISYVILATDGGIINKIIVDVFHGTAINFYTSPQYWVFILTFTAMWKTMGYSTIVYIAAINSIDTSLYEAAKIDGAGRTKQLWHVTLPGMYPVIGIQIVFSLGNLVRDDFDQICSMIRGSTSLTSTTSTIGVIVYQSIGSPSSYSSVAAMGILQGLIALVLVVVSNRILKSRGIQGAY